MYIAVPIGHAWLLPHLLLLQAPAAALVPVGDAPHLTSMGSGPIGASEMIPLSRSYIFFFLSESHHSRNGGEGYHPERICQT